MPAAGRRNLVARVMSAALVLVTACAPAQPAVRAHPPEAATRWWITFDDEFDGPAGSPPDPSRWLPDIGGTGWGNNELQYYTRSGNAFLDGQGHLVIEARRASDTQTCWYGTCQYTSGKVTTYGTFAQAYGRFEARMRVPAGRGFLPAFWLLGDNIYKVRHPQEGEIDVVETVGNQANRVQQHAHGPGLDFGYAYGLPAGQTVTDWHTYAIEWSPDRITWAVDGRLSRMLLRDDAGAGWVFDHPFFILLDLAVGGDWPGPPDVQTHFPARLEVDYVRAFLPEK
jgi:beta-glucanase (GH16 family)